MRSLNNEEKQTIERLKQMPQINDTRDKNDLYDQISSQLEYEKQPTRRRKISLIPVMCTLMAIAIILVVIPAIINNGMFQTQEELSSNKATDSASFSEGSSIEMDKQNDGALSDKGNPKASLFSTDPSNLVLHDVDDSHMVIHAAVADQQGQYTIPLAFIMPNTENKEGYYNQLEHYINADEWGVSPFLFPGATFKINEEKRLVVMKIPQEFSIDQGSTTATMIEDILSSMFGHLQINKVVFETTDNTGIDLGPIGTITEMPIKQKGKYSYKLYQSSEKTRKFLIPIPQQEQTGIEDALYGMKQNEDAFQVSQTIPNDIQFTIDTTNNQLILTFSEGNSLLDTSMNFQGKKVMIEAVLMTAKSFGYDSVKFINAGMEQIGKYNMNESVEVPLTINPITVEP